MRMKFRRGNGKEEKTKKRNKFKRKKKKEKIHIIIKSTGGYIATQNLKEKIQGIIERAIKKEASKFFRRKAL